MGCAPLMVVLMQACHRLTLETFISRTFLDGFEVTLERKVEVGEGCQGRLKARLDVAG